MTTSDDLIREHLDWARKQAIILGRKTPWLLDDLISEAYVALIGAARRYQPERGIKFTTFLYERIHGSILDFQRQEGLRGYKRNHQDGPALEYLSHSIIVAKTASGQEIVAQLDSLIPSNDLPIGWEAENLDEVIYLLRDVCGPKRATMFEYFTTAGMTMHELGKRADVIEATISYRIHAGIEEIRYYRGITKGSIA